MKDNVGLGIDLPLPFFLRLASASTAAAPYPRCVSLVLFERQRGADAERNLPRGIRGDSSAGNRIAEMNRRVSRTREKRRIRQRGICMATTTMTFFLGNRN